MSTYPLRALSKDGKEVVHFGIEDGPCSIENNLFILTNRPGSPILRYDTILRGLDIPDLFEGDIVMYDGSKFLLQYHRGFALTNPERGIITIENRDDLVVVSNIYKEPEVFIPKLVRQNFRTGNVYFTLENVIGVVEDKLLINAKEGMLVPFNEVYQYAGITYQGKRMYFGEMIEGRPLELHNGRCTININGSYKDITKGEI